MRRVGRGDVRKDDEETVSSATNFCHHLDEDLDEFEINDREMSLALGDGKR